MQTITFYSYKGGSGRSLALANAAIYLAKLGFKVVAVDFDLEAPGLHYKLSPSGDGRPLNVVKGVVDYLVSLLIQGGAGLPLDDFLLNATVPGIEEPQVYLMPAGQAPSPEYWSKLSRIDWHKLFYAKGARGVQIFKELQVRIENEKKPDFLLVDARTGITEMGGVATTLLADKLVSLVLPTIENLEGTRAVLQSLKRTRRENSGRELETIVAVSRLPEMSDPEQERDVTEWILSVMNQPARDSQDDLHLMKVFVLHSEAALQVHESLRVGSSTDPEDSVLLRDYLRLFATFVPRTAIEPKVRVLIDKAWEKLRSDPDAARKEMEELTESFPHPENYRELLKFYRARNVEPTLMLQRAQRLWEITRDSSDSYLWEVVSKFFEVKPGYQRKAEWYPDLSFVRALWRDAGAKDPGFGDKLAQAYFFEDQESVAADVLKEIMEAHGPSPHLVGRLLLMLDLSDRGGESDVLIEEFKSKFASEGEFASGWARHALGLKNKSALMNLIESPAMEKLRPTTIGSVYFEAGMPEKTLPIADTILKDIKQRDTPKRELDALAQFFADMERWDDFEKAVSERHPTDTMNSLRERVGLRPSHSIGRVIRRSSEPR